MVVILFFMGANIQIKYEIALYSVHFLTKIALYSVHLILLYTHVYFFAKKLFSRKRLMSIYCDSS